VVEKEKPPTHHAAVAKMANENANVDGRRILILAVSGSEKRKIRVQKESPTMQTGRRLAIVLYCSWE